MTTSSVQGKNSKKPDVTASHVKKGFSLLFKVEDYNSHNGVFDHSDFKGAVIFSSQYGANFEGFQIYLKLQDIFFFQFTFRITIRQNEIHYS